MIKDKELDKIHDYNSLVMFDIGGLDPSWWDKYPFKKGEVYIFLGEIPGLPGHCVVKNYKTGKIHSGYHTEDFIELPKQDFK